MLRWMCGVLKRLCKFEQEINKLGVDVRKSQIVDKMMESRLSRSCYEDK